MIDIHTHILPCVDDGSKSFESSVQLLKGVIECGVTDVILTPHYRKKFIATKDEILSAFEDFKSKVSDLPINIYIGREILVTKTSLDLLEQGKLLTLNGTKYVLLEFDYYNYTDIVEMVYVVKRRGFIPIVAHIERYEYLKFDDVIEIKNLGGLVQINASSVIKKVDKTYYKRVMKLLKNKLVDFVASDCHEFRTNRFLEARKLVEKKFGKDTAELLFNLNAKKIIQGQV